MTEDFSRLLDNTIVQRAESTTMAMLENLECVPHAVHWSRLRRPLDGRTAVIVGAGPSLDRNVEQLRASGAAVFAVNTSVGACVRAGVEVDVLVSIESVPLVNHVVEALSGGWVRTTALDVSAAPAMWRYALGHGTPVWLSSRSPEALEVSEGMGLPALTHGNAAVTAAAALAYEWGASRIVLVGCDLGYPWVGTGGACYASGSGWAGLDAYYDGERLLFEGRPDRDMAHDDAGVPRVPRHRERIEVPGLHGTTVVTTADYLWQLRWFESMAGVWDCDLVNATEGGAIVRGWSHIPLADALPDEVTPVSLWRYTTVGDTDEPDRAGIVQRARQTGDFAARMLRRLDVMQHPALIRPSEIVMSLVAPEVIRMERAGLRAIDRVHGVYQEMVRQSARVVEVMG